MFWYTPAPTQYHNFSRNLRSLFTVIQDVVSYSCPIIVHQYELLLFKSRWEIISLHNNSQMICCRWISQAVQKYCATVFLSLPTSSSGEYGVPGHIFGYPVVSHTWTFRTQSIRTKFVSVRTQPAGWFAPAQALIDYQILFKSVE